MGLSLIKLFILRINMVKKWWENHEIRDAWTINVEISSRGKYAGNPNDNLFHFKLSQCDEYHTFAIFFIFSIIEIINS